MATPPTDPAEIARRVAAYEQYGGNQTTAAKALGVSRERVQSAWRNAGLIGGPEPTAGYEITGMSSTYDADENLRSTSIRERPERGATVDALPGFAIASRTVHRVGGEAVQSWDREKPEAAAQHAAMLAFVAAMIEPVRGMSPLVAPPEHTDDDLLVVYPMGDPHFGLYSWGEETGENFDLAENERVHCAAIDRLVALAPNARHATLLNLGDFYHSDDSSNRTTKGTDVDVDGRYEKVMWTGAKAMRRCILRLLEKHETVRVRNVKGNHDGNAHFALAMTLAAFFENEPRVTVDMSPAKHTFQRFGKVLLGECHGDMAKGADLPGVMMNDARQHISETTFWHWHCGHVHHDSLKEYQNVVVETHRTLAGKDGWHTAQGYRSGRTMKAITYHREFGEVHRSTCDIAMLRNAA